MSYIERDLLIQHLMKQITDEGYIAPYITESDIDSSLIALRKVENVYHNGMFDFYKWCRKGKPIRPLIEKYCGIQHKHRGSARRTLDVAFNNLKVLFAALHHLICDKKWDINISTLHSMLYKMRYGPLWFDPVVFYAAIKQLFTNQLSDKSVIVDITPNVHEKMLTAWLLGCNYSAIGSQPPQDMANRIGTTLKPPTEPYDIAILDNALKPLDDLGLAVEVIKRSRNALIYVHPSQAKELSSIHKPSRIVRAHTSPIRAKLPPHYLFAYSGGPAKIQ